MTNDQRRKQVAELKEKLSPLNYEKIVVSLKHNYLSRPDLYPLSPEQQQDLNDLTQKLDSLNATIRPIFQALRNVQVKYFVEYDGVILQDGIKKVNRNQKEFYLASDVDIDSYKTQLDLCNPDVLSVINEISDYIYQREYSDFAIQSIKRLK